MERMDIAGLDLNLLVALDRLLTHRSVTRAAADLGLSQPATSRALGRLREVLGDELLVRVGREMLPTPRARALEGPAAAAVAAARAVFQPPSAFDPASAEGALVMALGDEALLAFGDAILAALRAAAPGVDLRVRALSAVTATEARQARIALALAPDLTALSPTAGAPDLSDFVFQPLYARRFVLATAADGGPLDLDGLCAATHAIVSFEAGGWGFVDDLLEAMGRRRRVAVSVPSFAAAARMVATAGVVATLPAELVALDPALRAWPHPLDLPRVPVGLVWHPRDTRDARHRFLRELVRDAVLSRVGAWATG